MWYAYLLLPAAIGAALLWRWWTVRQFRRPAAKWAGTGVAVLGELTAEIEEDQTPRSSRSSFPRRTIEKMEIVATPDALYCLTQRIRPSPGLWPRRLHLYTSRTALYNDARMTPRLGTATHAVSRMAIDGRQIQILIECRMVSSSLLLPPQHAPADPARRPRFRPAAGTATLSAQLVG